MTEDLKDDDDEYASNFDSESEESNGNNGASNIGVHTEDYSLAEGKSVDGSDENDHIHSDNDFDETSLYSPPEVKLAKLLNENINIDFNSAKENRIKCLALCKIVYGEAHWRVAEAHVQLANVYLKRKYTHQIMKHTKIARDILLSIKKSNCYGDESEREFVLQNLYYLMGCANYQLSKFKISENNLLKAKLVSDHTQNATSRYLNMKVNILSALGTTLSKLGQLGQAIEYIEEAIDTIARMPVNEKNLSVDMYKQIVSIELMNGKHANLSFAEETAAKALELSMEYNGKDTHNTAEIYILMSRVQILREFADFEKIEENLNEALRIYAMIELNNKVVDTQEMICKVLMKQEKFSAAKSMLKQAISGTEATLGDMSLRSARLYELMGNILFSENKMSSALIYFLKAEEIYKGKMRSQDSLVKLSKLIDIIRKSQKDDRGKTSEAKLKERPRFN